MVVGEAEQDSVERCKADGTHLGASRHEYGPAWVTSYPELQLQFSTIPVFHKTSMPSSMRLSKKDDELVYRLSLVVSGMFQLQSAPIRRQRDPNKTIEELGEVVLACTDLALILHDTTDPVVEPARHLRRSSGRLDPPAQVPGRKVRIIRGRFATRLEIETFLVKGFCGEDDPFGSELLTIRVIPD